MKIEAKKLAELNKQYNKLGKDEKIISIVEVKKKLDDIINLTEELEDMISEQMCAIEVVSDCDDGSCEIDDDIEQSELYDLYSELEDKVLSGNLYRVLRVITN